jgi:hypothetical protein
MVDDAEGGDIFIVGRFLTGELWRWFEKISHTRVMGRT